MNVEEPVRLFVIEGSPPCSVAMRALALKGVQHERVVMPFGPSMLRQQLRFGRRTVPGLQVGVQRVLGSRLILRALEGLVPAPSLYPSDPDARARHDEAERWGDLVWQEAIRWQLGLAFRNGPEEMAGYAEAGPPVPPKVLALGVRAEMRALGRTVAWARGELAQIPAYLDRIDGLFADGLLGTDEHPTAAGLQIGSMVRMALTFADLAPRIEGRPVAAFALGQFPDFPGHVPAGLLH